MLTNLEGCAMNWNKGGFKARRTGLNSDSATCQSYGLKLIGLLAKAHFFHLLSRAPATFQGGFGD